MIQQIRERKTRKESRLGRLSAAIESLWRSQDITLTTASPVSHAAYSTTASTEAPPVAASCGAPRWQAKGERKPAGRRGGEATAEAAYSSPKPRCPC